MIAIEKKDHSERNLRETKSEIIFVIKTTVVHTFHIVPHNLSPHSDSKSVALEP